MNQQSLLASSLSAGVAIGAGLASALLFIVSAKGSLLALALAYFAPLPLMIASLGFGQWTGLVGALLGSGLVATLLYPMVGLIYAVGIGVPAWFVCVAALRGAPPAEPQPTRPARAKTIAPAVPNPSPMRALAIATLYFAVAISVGALLLAAAHGGLASALGKLADELAPLIRDVKGATTSLPEGLDPDRLARVIVRVMVPAMAGSGLLLVMANLWLAARIVQISARLPTTWPDIPYNLRLPVPFAAALIPAIGLIFVGHEIGFVASIVATVLATALSLQGLAVMHDLTRDMSARSPLLFGAYLVMSFIPPWPMAVFALVGLADAALGLRERKRLRQSIPPTPP
ncbi:MAG: hypothetical protein WB663_11200 [Beijerinckiaceae bacterium]|jgi:hypothetical protein